MFKTIRGKIKSCLIKRVFNYGHTGLTVGERSDPVFLNVNVHFPVHNK